MKCPEVSVVMSVYNGANDLPATLQSVLDQQGCDFEFIVVNDGSADDSGRVLDEWAAQDARVRVFHQANTGLTRALMRGCAEARGVFIARQDVGDMSLPGRLKAQAELLRGSPWLVFSGCGYTLVGPGDEPLAPPFLGQGAVADGLRNRDGQVLPSPHHGTVMFRKQAYQQVGGYRPQFYFAQDVDLWSRLIECGDLGYVHAPLYQVKFDLNSITARHRPAQAQLGALIHEARALRLAGKSEDSVLQRAAEVRPGSSGAGRSSAGNRQGAAAYFVGSCLAQQGDPRASAYFLQAVRHDPLCFRAWYKLIRLAFTGSGAAS